MCRNGNGSAEYIANWRQVSWIGKAVALGIREKREMSISSRKICPSSAKISSEWLIKFLSGLLQTAQNCPGLVISGISAKSCPKIREERKRELAVVVRVVGQAVVSSYVPTCSFGLLRAVHTAHLTSYNF